MLQTHWHIAEWIHSFDMNMFPNRIYISCSVCILLPFAAYLRFSGWYVLGYLFIFHFMCGWVVKEGDITNPRGKGGKNDNDKD